MANSNRRRLKRSKFVVKAKQSSSNFSFDEELQSYIQKQKDKIIGAPPTIGSVYLVGTGPGDPGLLTLRALQLIQQADVILYDRLVSSDILSLSAFKAVMVYVGKREGFHTRSQEEIHALMALYAGHGACVVRLKGGDPYIFGRGGEELLYLQERGIPTYCVPGITAASGICSELGIPLTHRGVATSVRYLTGHSRAGGQEVLDDTIGVAADPNTTLVVYMGLRTLRNLADQLLEAGLSGDTPAVAVERGTTPQQRAVFGKLTDLPSLAAKAALKSPTLIVIGQVVGLSPGFQHMAESGQAIQSGVSMPPFVQGVHGTFTEHARSSLEMVEFQIGLQQTGETGEYIL